MASVTKFTVADGQSLTLTSDQALATTITGAGTIVLVGSIAGDDLSGFSNDLDISAATGVPTAVPDLLEGQELRLTAAQVVALAGDSVAIAGDGDVAVELDDIAAASFDLSTIDVTGTVTVEFGNAGTLHASTNMTGVGVVVLAADDVDGNTLVRTTMTSAQANGVVFSGEGTVEITASAGLQTLEGTAGDDIIWGDEDAATTDTVDLGSVGGGGTDTLKFYSAENGMTVTGFTTGTGTGHDVLDFSNLNLVNNAENGAETDTASATVYSGTNLSIYDNINGKLAGLVIALADLESIDSASTLATAFSVRINGQMLNSFVSPNSKLIFLTGSDREIEGELVAGADTKIWLWDDTTAGAGTGNGSLNSNELTLLGTLEGVTMAALQALRDDNVVYNPIPI